MKIAILNIGDELLDGRTTNSNASFFAAVLKGAGLTVQEVRMVEDNADAIVAALEDLSIYDEVIVSGGLGPTADDITAMAAAKFSKQPQVYLPAAEKMIRRQLAPEKQKYSLTQRRQAFLPKKAKIIDNRWGIAPGFWLCARKTNYSFLPGVPRECRPMLEKVLLPRILASDKSPQRIKEALIWQCFGAKEADLYSLIASDVEQAQKKFGDNFSFSCLIPFPIIQIRVEFWQGRGKRSATKEERKRFVAALNRTLKQFIFTRKNESLAQNVLSCSSEISVTISTAESCTGGMIGAALTDISGSSDTYLGGVVSYSNETKQRILGVQAATLRRHGAVSEAVVCEMAEGVRDKQQSDFAVAISGIAGPGGGSKEKPVGTLWCAVAGPKRTITRHVLCKQGKGTREQNRRYAVVLALNLLRLELESMSSTR